MKKIKISPISDENRSTPIRENPTKHKILFAGKLGGYFRHLKITSISRERKKITALSVKE